MIVLDACVAAKWVLPETQREEALRLLAEHRRFIAPALIRIEVPAAILGQVRRGTIQADDGRRAYEKWRELLDAGVFELISDIELLPTSIEMAFQARHAVQDCLYLAAAKIRNAEFITVDPKLLERGKSVWKKVRPLPGLQGR